MLETLLLSLVLTVIFELLYAIGWKLHGNDLWLVVGMNILTNPLVVLWNAWTLYHGYLVSTLLPELCAIAVEAVVLIKFGKDVYFPVLLAICINVFSYILGLFINYVLYIL